jgi:hypothetical protein
VFELDVGGSPCLGQDIASDVCSSSSMGSDWFDASLAPDDVPYEEWSLGLRLSVATPVGLHVIREVACVSVILMAAPDFEGEALFPAAGDLLQASLVVGGHRQANLVVGGLHWAALTVGKL